MATISQEINLRLHGRYVDANEAIEVVSTLMLHMSDLESKKFRDALKEHLFPIDIMKQPVEFPKNPGKYDTQDMRRWLCRGCDNVVRSGHRCPGKRSFR